ncbi:efflux RND transporter periplasmic adaptor subunit [Dokdonella sp. MW10]|uniref:efflux RND transporter periplasmic adaptor subunit n=1 Tax=Dokdonella sp. MW10 TaxID=2992926 RepID=UPI003F7FF2E8
MHASTVVTRALAALLAVACHACSSHAEPPPPPRVARAAQPQPADAQILAIYPGEVRARHESGLGFRVAGKLRTRHADVGSRVAKGDLLAELDPRDLELGRASAAAGHASALAALKLAESEHERFAALHEKRFVSQLELDAKANALAAAQARATEARAALDVARNQAGYAELRADADGVITAVGAEPGQVVAAGHVVVQLAHDGANEVEISVPEQQVARYAPGQDAMIDLWADRGEPRRGRVREVAPGADATTRTYRVRVAFEGDAAPPRLGQTARVHFGGDAAADQWLVPLSALHERDGKPALWRIDAKTHQVGLVPVTVASYGEHGAIVGGVTPDAWIVTAGVHRLRDGEVVRPVDARNRPVMF